jgi:hypothetical protein
MKYTNKEALLPYELAHSLLEYNPDTGLLSWKVTKGPRALKGGVAGSKHSSGYVQIGINKVQFLVHRVTWLLFYKEWPSTLLDHIDGDKTNNRIANLRPCNTSQNKQNIGLNKNNSSGYKGVHFDNTHGKYKAQIQTLEGNRKHLGLFSTPEEASEVYNRAAKELHGEFYKDTRK